MTAGGGPSAIHPIAMAKEFRGHVALRHGDGRSIHPTAIHSRALRHSWPFTVLHVALRFSWPSPSRCRPSAARNACFAIARNGTALHCWSSRHSPNGDRMHQCDCDCPSALRSQSRPLGHSHSPPHCSRFHQPPLIHSRLERRRRPHQAHARRNPPDG